MVLLLTANFLVNLLCARYDCNAYYQAPSPFSVISKRVLELDVTEPTEPIVFTQSGGVEGYFMTVNNNRQIFAFEGIPYAEPPVKNNRFRDPIPKQPWYSIRNAKAPSKDCLQLNLIRYFQIVGSEDCLYLNVYTPQIKTSRSSPKLPVVIFIHGGTFILGAGREYGPSYLLGLEEDVILVTINYRLGVLGFMSSGDEESLGNWGLKDQSLGIKWVYDNIEAFGGDPRKITLTGQSAGAVAVHLQMMSTTSVARGMFSRAASFSGSAFHHWGLQTPEYASIFTNKIAKNLRCPTDTGSAALVDCLRRINGNFLVGAQRFLYLTTVFPFILFAPVIEKNTTGAFITGDADYYYRNNLVMDIPYLNTNAASESIFLFLALKNVLILNYYVRNYKTLIPFLFDFGRFVNSTEEALEKLSIEYYGSAITKTVDNGLRLNISKIYEFGADRYFSIGNRKTLKAHSKIAQTYSYIYKFRGESSIATTLYYDYKKTEATHADDIAVMFNSSLLFTPVKPNTLQLEVSKAMLNLLYNFAEKGEPLYTSEDGEDNRIWDPVTPENIQFLEIGEDASFKMIKETEDKVRKLKLFDDLGIY